MAAVMTPSRWVPIAALGSPILHRSYSVPGTGAPAAAFGPPAGDARIADLCRVSRGLTSTEALRASLEGGGGTNASEAHWEAMEALALHVSDSGHPGSRSWGPVQAELIGTGRRPELKGNRTMQTDSLGWKP
jgi:hypothetical protein